MRDSKSRSRGAFTLVEILVVVVILGIIATVVGVSIGSRDDLKAKATARVLAANLQYLQSRAVVRAEPHYVIIGTSRDSINFAVRSSGSWMSLTHPIDRNEFRMIFGINGSGGGQGSILVTEDFDANQLMGVDETGAPFFCDNNGDNRVTASVPATFLLASGDYQILVSVEPITGEISISD